MKKLFTTYMLRSVFIIFVCSCFQKNIYAQQSNWLLGEWKSGSPSDKKAAKRIPYVVLHIYKIEANHFDALLRITFSQDSSYHADSKVSGNIFRNYITAELGETVYKRMPYGSVWESKCTQCGPIIFRFSIEEKAFVLTGITTGCNTYCDGISTYYRSMNEFDDATKSSLAILAVKENSLAANEDKPTLQAAANNNQPLSQQAYIDSIKKEEQTAYDNEEALHKKLLAAKHDALVEGIEKSKHATQNSFITPTVLKKNKGAAIIVIRSNQEIMYAYEEALHKKLIAVQQNALIASIEKSKPAVQKKFSPPIVLKRNNGAAIIATTAKKEMIAKKDTLKQEPLIAQQKNQTSSAEKTKPVQQKKDTATIAKKNTGTQPVAINTKKEVSEKKDNPQQRNQNAIADKPVVIQQKKDSITTALNKTTDTTTSAKISLPEKKPEVFEKRNTNLVTAYAVDEDSITLRLFDNGIVDGDTVSVFYNDSVVVQRLALTAKVFQLKLPVDKTKDNKVVLYAHNLGEIAPNSALLQVFTKNKQYQLTVSSDLQNSSGIVLRYEGKQGKAQ